MSITVRNLTKRYGEQKAIDDLSFDVKTGEILGFLGPNGAGKTTTMKIITCYMPPSAGTVEVDGLADVSPVPSPGALAVLAAGAWAARRRRRGV